jgi:predicted nucleic acid-binding protein
MSAGFLLDTNVLSELMRETPAPQVMTWFETQNARVLQTSAITHAEILAGIALLPSGKRREAMALAACQIFEEDFLGRCLEFGGQAIVHYAMVRAQRQRIGRPIDTAGCDRSAATTTVL